MHWILALFWLQITCESHIASNYFHKRKSFPLVCFVCGNQNPMDIPLDVIASHSSAHPVCMMCSQMGYKPRLRKKSLLGKRKNWLGINLQCVLFQSVHVILTEPVYFIKYMAVWNFCLLIFMIQIQIIKIQKGAKLTHAETFVSVLKKSWTKD